MRRTPEVRFPAFFEKYRHRILDRETGLPFEPTARPDQPFTFERLAFQTGAGCIPASSTRTYVFAIGRPTGMPAPSGGASAMRWQQVKVVFSVGP